MYDIVEFCVGLIPCLEAAMSRSIGTRLDSSEHYTSFSHGIRSDEE